jgi:hypothetical protein
MKVVCMTEGRIEPWDKQWRHSNNMFNIGDGAAKSNGNPLRHLGNVVFIRPESKLDILKA